jgi:hypothetical protein
VLTKGVVYYSHPWLDPVIAETCRQQLLRAVGGHYLVSVTLQPLDFGNMNINLGLVPGYLSMFKQILTGVSNVQEDLCYLAEHDVLYAPGAFDFVPPRNDLFYYNQNVWQVSAQTGQALFYRRRSVSMLCAHTQLLIDHYGDRIKFIEEHGFSFKQGFEPGCKRISHGGIDNRKSDVWFSEKPNIDIKDHGSNVTLAQWEKAAFKNQKNTEGWTEAQGVPHWGRTFGRFESFLEDVAEGRVPV